MDFKLFYSRYLRYIWLAIIVFPCVAVILCYFLWPDIIYNQFLWRYFIGPVVADAQNHPVDGISEGYNIVNTIVYAFILILGFFGVYEIFNRKKIDVLSYVDLNLVLAILPFFILGGVTRALEDSGLYSTPTVYFFIAPIIYVTVAMLAGFSMIISVYAHKFSMKNNLIGIIFTIIAFICIDSIYIFLYIQVPNLLFYFPTPVVIVAISAIFLAILIIISLKLKILKVVHVFAAFGMFFLAISVYIMCNWTHSGSWTSNFELINNYKAINTHYLEIFAILGLALFLTAIVWLIGFIISKKIERFRYLLSPMTIIMTFAQFLDGAATYRGISLFGYQEKHVLPSSLITYLGNPAIILVLKLILIVLVIYLTDFLIDRYKNLASNLSIMIKTLVIMLGLSPGVRDMCRIAMGV